MEFIIIIHLILSVISGALSDGFYERNWKELSHNFEIPEKPLLLASGVLSCIDEKWLTALTVVILSYTAFRVALFDPIKNKAAGQPILYHGTVGWWDRLLNKNSSIPGEIFGRVIFLTFAVAVIIIEL